MTQAGDNINTFPVVPSVWLGDMVINLKRTNHQKFMDVREVLIEAYEGDNLKALTDVWFTNKKTNKVQENVPGAEQNLLDRAIRRISLVYKDMPDYGLTDMPEGYDQLKRWRFMKFAERTANNIGTVLLRPVVRNGVMDYDLIWNYIPFFEDDPLTPTGILYSVVTPSANVSDVPEIEWVFWTADNLVLFDSNMTEQSQTENPESENKFGVLPFVTVNVRQGQTYWNWGYGKPLLDANTSINVALTEMRLGIRFAMMGQWVATGVDENTKIKMGVDQVQKLPVGATLDAKAPPANIADAVTYLKTETEITFQNIGLQITWADDGGVPSGESLKIKNIELIERREDDVTTWFVADNELYDLEQIVWEKSPETKGKLPDDRHVNYTEVAFPVTPEEQQARDQWALDHGLITEAQIMVRDNPDKFEDIVDGLSAEDQAQALIELNKTKLVVATPARVSRTGRVGNAT